jgi:hypothetical protein
MVLLVVLELVPVVDCGGWSSRTGGVVVVIVLVVEVLVLTVVVMIVAVVAVAVEAAGIQKQST